MKIILLALAGLMLPSLPTPSATALIRDPAKFVAEVYRHYVAAEKTGGSFDPPEDVYAERLARLVAGRRTIREGTALDSVSDLEMYALKHNLCDISSSGATSS